MTLLCQLSQTDPLNVSLFWEKILTIVLGGIGGVIVAALVTILYDFYKSRKKRSNLYKGFISEMEVNKEYLKHNHSLADIIQKGQEKPTIFIPVRANVCLTILTSGEIKLDLNTRKFLDHYLVTLDHLNQMIKTIERTENNNKEYEVAIERIKRYCRSEPVGYSDNFDYVIKNMDTIKDILFKKKKFLKRYFA
jgi:hypothetical protein